MQRVTESAELEMLAQENRFFGTLPEMKNSAIVFKGSRNILFCEDSVLLVNTNITFHGDDSIVFLRSNKHEYKLNISIYNHSAFYMGKNNYINGIINIILSEQKHVFIGDGGLFSLGIWMRMADPHLVYDIGTRERINPTKSIYIGDHVWVGQSAMILKGTQIDSGSIIGAMSLVSGKKIPANTSWAGNPVRLLRDNIFWEGSCVHAWTDTQTKNCAVYKEEHFIYHYDGDGCVPFDEIDRRLSGAKTAQEKLVYLQEINQNQNKNRFVNPVGSSSAAKKLSGIFGRHKGK